MNDVRNPDPKQSLAEIDRQIVEVDREQYAMAKSNAPRDADYTSKAAALDARYQELRRQELALQTSRR